LRRFTEVNKNMRQNSLKLAVAIVAFVLGLAGSAFWYFERIENKNNERIVRILVKGRVVDAAGRPNVRARADGYAEEWINFDCWDKGERRFQQTIVLKPQIENTENKNK
jgi:hypothetical protein